MNKEEGKIVRSRTYIKKADNDENKKQPLRTGKRTTGPKALPPRLPLPMLGSGCLSLFFTDITHNKTPQLPGQKSSAILHLEDLEMFTLLNNTTFSAPTENPLYILYLRIMKIGGCESRPAQWSASPQASEYLGDF